MAGDVGRRKAQRADGHLGKRDGRDEIPREKHAGDRRRGREPHRGRRRLAPRHADAGAAHDRGRPAGLRRRDGIGTLEKIREAHMPVRARGAHEGCARKLALRDFHRSSRRGRAVGLLDDDVEAAAPEEGDFDVVRLSGQDRDDRPSA